MHKGESPIAEDWLPPEEDIKSLLLWYMIPSAFIYMLWASSGLTMNNSTSMCLYSALDSSASPIPLLY